MSILNKVTKGPQSVPVRAVIYGVEGIGKSSLASLFPKPLLVDLEDGSHHLNVERVSVGTWTGLGEILTELAATKHPYQTIILDTADWAERYCTDAILRPKNYKSIEDFGYGKGYTVLAEEFARKLTLCDILIGKGMNVVWIAHSKVTRVSPPDETDGFDRYEMKLTKHVAPLLKEWSDLLLFANYKIQIVEGEDGKVKAQGGKDRILYTTRSAALDAKNRYNLPEILPMKNGELPRELLGVFSFDKNAGAKPVAAPITQAAPATQQPPADPEKPISAENITKLEIYAKNSIGGPIIDKALAHYGQVSISDFSEKQAATVIKRCQDEMNADAAATDEKKAQAKKAAANNYPWQSLLPWLEANEEKLNTYFVSVKWLQSGQTFRELPHDRCDKVKARPAAVARAAGINPPSE